MFTLDAINKIVFNSHNNFIQMPCHKDEWLRVPLCTALHCTNKFSGLFHISVLFAHLAVVSFRFARVELVAGVFFYAFLWCAFYVTMNDDLWDLSECFNFGVCVICATRSFAFRRFCCAHNCMKCHLIFFFFGVPIDFGCLSFFWKNREIFIVLKFWWLFQFAFIHNVTPICMDAILGHIHSNKMRC